jgi:hypothetical protein
MSTARYIRSSRARSRPTRDFNASSTSREPSAWRGTST